MPTSVTTRCKASCASVQQSGDGFAYTFYGVYSTDPNHENKKFWDATPSFNLSTTIKGPQRFEQGKEYHIEITPA